MHVKKVNHADDSAQKKLISLDNTVEMVSLENKHLFKALDGEERRPDLHVNSGEGFLNITSDDEVHRYKIVIIDFLTRYNT